jgi:thiamine pyrophosphate-dependent acetolactate synthase large subunit-like protein
MADAHGRLTGRAGVCLDRRPRSGESGTAIDLIGIMRPIVKWNLRDSSREIVPEVGRKALPWPRPRSPRPLIFSLGAETVVT